MGVITLMVFAVCVSVATGMVEESCFAPFDDTEEITECGNEEALMCEAGSIYHPTTKTCVYECDQYADTFKVFRNHAINGFNIKKFAFISPKECAELCILEQGFTCVTFDYEPARKKCFLQSITAHDEPDSYMPHAKYDHYQRNCAGVMRK